MTYSFTTPKNNKEKLTYLFANSYVQIHDTHMIIYSTYIITKYRARNSFMTKSFLFDTQSKSFYEPVISILL